MVIYTFNILFVRSEGAVFIVLYLMITVADGGLSASDE